MSQNRIEPLSLGQRLLSGGIYAFLAKVVTLPLGLLIMALLARLLSPEEMAAYFLTLNFAIFAVIFADMGLSQVVVRLVASANGAGEPARARMAVKRVFGLAAISAAAQATLILIFGADVAEGVFSSRIMAVAMPVTAFWVVILLFQNLLAETCRGYQEIKLAMIVGGHQGPGGAGRGLVAGAVLTLMLVVAWGVDGHLRLTGVVVLSLAAGLVGAAVVVMPVIAIYRRAPPEGKLTSSEVLSVAWPILLTNLSVFASYRAAILFLGAFRGSEEVALYGAASQVASLAAMPLLIMYAVTPPIIAELNAKGDKAYVERVLRLTSTVAVIPSVMLALAYLMFGSQILAFVYPDFYGKAGIILAILGVAHAFNTATGLSVPALLMLGHEKFVALLTFILGGSALVLYALVVPEYGYVATAVVWASLMLGRSLVATLYLKSKCDICAYPSWRALSEVLRARPFKLPTW